MTKTLDAFVAEGESEAHASTYEAPVRHDGRKAERPLDAFLAELRKMTPQERIRGSRYSFNYRERWIYAAHYPDEVPLINGELEWIVRDLV